MWTFKKAGENQHGQIVNVISEKGFCVGSIAKWHGLFVATDWEGHRNNMPFKTRVKAAKALLDEFEFMARNS